MRWGHFKIFPGCHRLLVWEERNVKTINVNSARVWVGGMEKVRIWSPLEREKTSARSVEIESKSDLSSKNSPRLADCIWQPESQSQIEIHKKLDYSANKREGSKNVDGILKCWLSHIIIAGIKDQSPLLVVSAGLFY